MTKLYLGWKPDDPDYRDLTYGVHLEKLEKYSAPLPAKVDLRPHFDFEVYDQGMTNSCVSQAVCAAVRYNQIRINQATDYNSSRLFVYWNSRSLHSATKHDDGTFIRNAIKSLARWGYCEEEKFWNFKSENVQKCPPKEAYAEAYHHKAVKYFSLNHTKIEELKTCLAASYPFVFGSIIYQPMEEAAEGNGVVPMPEPYDRPLGGHAMLCVGYDDKKQHFIIRNSWGPNSGDKGYFYMPYEYLTSPNLTDDVWTIRKLSDIK